MATLSWRQTQTQTFMCERTLNVYLQIHLRVFCGIVFLTTISEIGLTIHSVPYTTCNAIAT